MHLSSLINPAGSVVIFRRTVFLVHLFYLSASILLARLAHGAQKLPPADGTALLPRYDIAEVKIAAGDGVHAARTAARILQLQMDEQAVFQRCWNCEYGAPNPVAVKVYADLIADLLPLCLVLYSCTVPHRCSCTITRNRHGEKNWAMPAPA